MTVAIGAPSGVFTENSGSVRVFTWLDGWIQLGEDLDGEASGDRFGASVSLSSDGTFLAVGAPNNDNNGNSSGKASIHFWNGTVWSQIGEDIIGTAVQYQLGTSVSLSADGGIVAIGAPGSDSPANSGSALIFKREGNSWVQLGVTINGEDVDDFSGSSVSLSSDGTRIIVGAPENDGGGENSGHAKVYDLECD